MSFNYLLLLYIGSFLHISVQGRAVNISNTWMLPEEGFPVFYRYFRDRISWYEADAVCQFHHGNLVTVDTTSQFDAVRAYLKELDIISNVWLGLLRPADKTQFFWSNNHSLNGDGYWQETLPISGTALCAAADPAADFRWHALPCGGPEVASFICELSVPPWASSADGCMLTAIPSLTVIYLPEQTAVELTSDCGLDGTKRIVCKGKANRDETMRQLSCSTRYEFDEKPVSKPPAQPTTVDASNIPSTRHGGATKPWIWTSNTIDTEDLPTRHRRETEQDTFSTTSHMDTTRTTTITTTTTIPETTRQKPIITTTTTTPVEAITESSSINQGQMFSIIENGTVFDIIEMNETSSDGYSEKTTSTIKPNASIQFQLKRKDLSKTVNDLSDTSEDKTFMKPSDSNALIKLNRTNRKELPFVVDLNATESSTEVIPMSKEHKIVEITITNLKHKSDNVAKLFVTTKNKKVQKKALLVTNVTTELPSTAFINVTMVEDEELNTTEETEELEESKRKTGTEEPAESVPEAAPRPNRNRVLTRPQRRSFYPYFFSRVLG